jgi:hypothetical protein
MFMLVVLTVFLFGAGDSRDNPHPCWSSDTVKFLFEDTYSDKYKIVSVQVEILNENGESAGRLYVEDLSGVKPVDGYFVLPMYATFYNLPDGLYSARVRVFNDGGSASPWSPEFWFRKRWIELPAPANCRMAR